MKKLLLLSTVIALSISSCSTPKPSIDTTPTHETVVLNAKTSIGGSILPKNTGTQKVFTRPTERRINTNINYDSWFARKFFTNTDTALIGSTEKNLSWYINNTTKTYIECPLYGCSTNIWKDLPKNDESNDEDLYQPNTPASCEMTTKTDYDVVDKKVSRVINGFTANQYQLIWSVENKDKQGKADSHKIIMDFWMTTPTDTMQKAWAINGQFQQNYLKAVGANDSPLGRMLGQQVYMALAAISGDTEKNPDLKLLNGKLAKLEGYPISIKLEWFIKSEACKNDKKTTETAKSPNFDLKDAAGSLRSLAGGLLKDTAKTAVAKKFTLDPNEPVLRYIYDVESVSIEDQRDSVFTVPAKYKLENRQ